MKEPNVKSLENLGKTSKLGGLLPVFLGIIVGFVGLINKNMYVMLTGLLIFIMGYAFVKIGVKVLNVLQSEK